MRGLGSKGPIQFVRNQPGYTSGGNLQQRQVAQACGAVGADFAAWGRLGAVFTGRPGAGITGRLGAGITAWDGA